MSDGKWRWAVLLAALCLAIAGCADGGASGVDPSTAEGETATAEDETTTAEDELDVLIEQARSEGELNLQFGDPTMGGIEGIPQIAEGFRTFYGLPDDFAVNYTPGGSYSQQLATLRQEVLANQPATSDIYVGSSSYVAEAIGEDLLQALDWSWAAEVPAEAVGPNGSGVVYETAIPGIVYNSDAVDQPPASMEDLLEPQYEGRVASTPYAANLDYVAAMWGQDQTRNYIEELSGHIGGVIACNEMDALLIGQFDIFGLSCSHNDAVKSEATGGPLRFVAPADAPILYFYYATIPVNSANPAAARLWINYLMTRDAQDVLYDVRAGDSSYLEGSGVSEVIERYESEGVEFEEWTAQRVLESDDFPTLDYLGELINILATPG